jgi:prophage tail gpP-like protein
MWGGWTSFEATRQIDSLCAEFAVGLTDRWTPESKRRPLAAGMPCQVELNEKILLKGYLDKVDFSLGSGNHAIQASGRDISCDLVDCSALHSPGQWKGLGLGELAKILAGQFDIQVGATYGVLEALAEPFPVFKLEEGETAFKAIDRACKQREVLLISLMAGNTEFAKIGEKRSETPLIQGLNVLDVSASYDLTDRFSDYIVKGQKQGNDQDYGPAVAAIRGEGQDESVPRYRPLIIRAENQGDTADAIKRAQWEATVRAGRSVTVAATVQGWFQDNGDLWDINHLISCDFPYLNIKQDLLISKLTYSLTLDGGVTTKMELKDPKAFEPEPPKKEASKGSGEVAKPVELQQASAESAWTAHREALNGAS